MSQGLPGGGMGGFGIDRYIIQWDANIKWPGILEFNRNWIAYANETIIVNKDSLIAKISVMSLIVINMPTRELLAGQTKSSFV